ncbi:MAG: DNA-directed RNA polymerase I subunit RPA2, partial [Marteilia pararefringens]
MADCDEKQLKSLSRPHIDSFNYSFSPEGLSNFVKYFGNFYHSLKDGSKLKLFLEAIEIEKPRITRSGQECSVFPTECRQRNTTYRGQLLAQIGVKLNGEYKGCFVKSIGYLPIMVGSSFCNTSNLNENEMYRKGEEVSDPGGYFIVKGFQKFLRLLVMYRRNYPICEKKAIWKSRGENFTEYGINMRCVRGDQTAASTIFHHLIDDSVVICIVYQKELFFVPILLIMKCLINCTDYSLLKFMLQWEPNNKQYESSIIQMLFSLADNSVFTRQDALKFIGQRFRHKTDCPEWFSNEKIGKYIIKNLIAIHLDNNNDKLSFLAYVYHKLFRFANGHIEAENSDSISYQEVLTPGNMIQIVLKERLTKWFEYLINSIEAKSSSITLANCDLNSISNIASGVVDISQSIEYFFSTGNFSTKNSYGLRQLSGFVMQADYINFTMFISNFCAIHRGTSFSGTTNTNVRKLLPSHWGFICPLNTPDGDPCGLLNYLTYCSSICFANFDKNIIRKFLHANQVLPISIGDEIESFSDNSYINVILDGIVIGKTSLDNARKLKRIIRVMRIK